MNVEFWLRPEVLSAAIALLGTLLGILGTLAVTWVTKRFEDRRHLRELAITAALEDYKIRREDISRSGGGRIPPIDDYIVHMLCVAEVISKRRLRPEAMDHVLGALRSISSRTQQFYESEGMIRPEREKQQHTGSASEK